MLKHVVAGILMILSCGNLVRATIIIDDFTVGPSSTTMPPYLGPPGTGIGTTRYDLDFDHVWGGYRKIVAGSYPIREPDTTPIATMTVAATGGGHFLFYSDAQPEGLSFRYSARGGNASLGDPLIAPPLDFSVTGAAIRIDVDSVLRMDRVWFGGHDVNGRTFGKYVDITDSVEPFSIELTLGPSDEYDGDKTSISAIGLMFVAETHGFLSIDNIVFVPELSDLWGLLFGAIVWISGRRYRKPSL